MVIIRSRFLAPSMKHTTSVYFCAGVSSTLVLPGGGSQPLLVQGQSFAPVEGSAAEPVEEQREVETEMGPAVTIMKPILRFLQLLCENHNQDLQVCLLRPLSGKTFMVFSTVSHLSFVSSVS